MRNLLLVYNDLINLSGSFTSIFDLYFSLSKFVNAVDIRMMFDIKNTDMIKYLEFQNFFGHRNMISKLTKKRDYEADTIIISCQFLTQMAENKIEVDIECDKLILLDSLDLQRSVSNMVPKLDNISNYIFYNDCILLSNPSNFGIIDVPTLEYYHKFDVKRVLSRNYEAKRFDYRRTDKEHIILDNGVYFENIGKLIFENIFVGNEVNYYPDGLGGNVDGLCYYLELFGIDPNKEHLPLKISREEVIEKLFFNESDKILEVI